MHNFCPIWRLLHSMFGFNNCNWIIVKLFLLTISQHVSFDLTIYSSVQLFFFVNFVVIVVGWRVVVVVVVVGERVVVIVVVGWRVVVVVVGRRVDDVLLL